MTRCNKKTMWTEIINIANLILLVLTENKSREQYLLSVNFPKSLTTTNYVIVSW